MLQEFREFAMRGNVIDLAVGVVIGTAFGAITNSLVKDVIMPPIGILMGKVDFSDLKFTMIEAAEGAEAVTINYGLFLQTLVNFVIVAWAMFMIIKVMNKMKRKQDAGAADAPPPPRQEILLEEIRDLLKK
ncbi:MAG: large-conductance mechanosensitive channel protein MscL [Alphaproteobacteria bacterium]|nr:large-conductance mechanosensitive channel protein MscL [Alphaproteobacteria bacterium]